MSEPLTATSLLDRFDISADDLTLIQECGQALGTGAIDRVLDRFYDWLSSQPEFNTFFSGQDVVERAKKSQKAYWSAFFRSVVAPRSIAYRVHIGEIFAARDLPSLVYFPAMLRFQLLFLEELRASDLAADRLALAT